MSKKRISVTGVSLVTIIAVIVWLALKPPSAQGLRRLLGLEPQCKPLSSRPLRVGITPWAGFGGGLLGNSGFRSSEVEFVIFEKSDQERKAALTGCAAEEGKLDVVWTSVESWAAELPEWKGVNARLFMVFAQANGARVWMTDWMAHRSFLLKDLHSITFTGWSPAEYVLRQHLPDLAATILPKPTTTEAFQAFSNREAEALVLSEPSSYVARSKSQAVSHPSAEPMEEMGKDAVNYALVVRDEVISSESGRIRLKALINSWLDSNRKALSNAEKLAKLLSDTHKVGIVTQQEVQSQLQDIHIHLASVADNMILFDLDAVQPFPDGILTEGEACTNKFRTETDANAFNEIFKQANYNWAIKWKLTSEAKPEDAKEVSPLQDVFLQTNSLVDAPPGLCEPRPKNGAITIHFDSTEAALKDPAIHSLDDLSYQLRTDDRKEICIWGHTDSRGDDRYNQSLSCDRAIAVAKYVRRLGVAKIDSSLMRWVAANRPAAMERLMVARKTVAHRSK